MTARISVAPPYDRLATILQGFAVAILVIVPCLWLPRIPSADYPSHLYNTWLKHQIQNGPVAGVEVVPTWTNVLADWLLEFTADRSGMVTAEFLVPMIAVTVFFWGAFFWIGRASGKAPWELTPILAAISYGVVFHLGFLNYYLSAGLCLWVLGLAWRPQPRHLMAALGLVGLALLAHPLPVLWTACILLYVGAERITPRDLRGWLPLAAIVLLGVAHGVLESTFDMRPVWEVEPIGSILLGMVGTEQLWVFGPKYFALAVAVALWGAVLIWHRIDANQLHHTSIWDDPRFHLWIIHGAAFVLMPASVQLPLYKHLIGYIPERLSLFGALTLCLMLAGAASVKRTLILTLPVAAVFFSFLYVDGLAYNGVSAQVEELVRPLPEGQRVVGPVYDEGARIPALIHVADRACVGRCWSFADYEPATGQFRIQATAENPVVAWEMADVQKMERGEFVVRPMDEPVYSVCACSESGSELCLRRLTAGTKTCATTLSITPRWWRKR